jgi:hypothetical protein
MLPHQRLCLPADIKEAVALALSALTVRVEVTLDHDRFYLKVLKADGSLPSPDEVKALLPTAGAADQAVAAASKALLARLASNPVPFKLNGDSLAVRVCVCIPMKARC